MKNFSLKKALTAVVAMSVVSCAVLPVVSLEASAVDSIHVAIDKKTVTLAELKASDYQVPIYVRMNEGHPGLNAMECGFSVDSRCTYEVINKGKKAMELGGEGLDVSMTTATNMVDGESITWMAWAASEDDEWLENMALIMVTVPSDAKSGNVYNIKYRSAGVNPKNPTKVSPHLFKSKDGTDYVAAGAVTSSDGWILVAG